jgi:hypothetical protein
MSLIEDLEGANEAPIDPRGVRGVMYDMALSIFTSKGLLISALVFGIILLITMPK